MATTTMGTAMTTTATPTTTTTGMAMSTIRPIPTPTIPSGRAPCGGGRGEAGLAQDNATAIGRKPVGPDTLMRLIQGRVSQDS